MLAVLEDAYQEEIVVSSQLTRKVLRLHPLLSPYFAAIIPAEKSLREKSYQLHRELLKNPFFSVAYEETGNIGNRYRRQDAIGTYYCLTVDTLTINEYLSDGKPNPDYNTVTLRHRNTMKQEKKRINIDNLEDYLKNQYQKFHFSINE
jgi:glycyl-tRNA synthetase